MENLIILQWVMGGGIVTIVIFAIATYVRTDKQIGRVYQRLDEKTDKLKNETVNVKICEVIHKNVDSRLEKIEHLTEDIPKIATGINLLLKKDGLNKEWT